MRRHRSLRDAIPHLAEAEAARATMIRRSMIAGFPPLQHGAIRPRKWEHTHVARTSQSRSYTLIVPVAGKSRRINITMRWCFLLCGIASFYRWNLLATAEPPNATAEQPRK